MEEIETIFRREEIFGALSDGPLHKRDLVEQLDVSRSTVDRAVREFEDANLVQKGENGYTLSLLGRLVMECFHEYRSELEAIFGAEQALTSMPTDCDLPLTFIGNAETYVATDPAPYRPMERIHGTIRRADEFRVLLPVLYDTRFLEECYDHCVTQGNGADLVVDSVVVETVKEDFPSQFREKAACDWFTLRTGDTPPYGLLLTTDDHGTTATVVVFGESLGPVHAVMQSDAPAAVEWAEQRFEQAVAASTTVTDSGPDGAVAESSGKS